MDVRLTAELAVFVAVAIFAGLVSTQITGTCDEQNLMVCRQLLAELIVSRKLAIVSNKDQLIQQCPELQNAMQCVDDFTFKCYRKEVQEKVNRLYSGIRDFLQDLCNEGDVQNGSKLGLGTPVVYMVVPQSKYYVICEPARTQRNLDKYRSSKYLQHAPCMVTLEQKDHDQCSGPLSNTTNYYPNPNDEYVNSDSLQFNPELCCPFHDMSVCSRRMYQEKCGAEAAAIADKLLMKMVGPVVRESCLNNNNEFQCSSSSYLTTAHALPLLLAAILTTLSYYYTCSHT